MGSIVGVWIPLVMNGESTLSWSTLCLLLGLVPVCCDLCPGWMGKPRPQTLTALKGCSGIAADDVAVFKATFVCFDYEDLCFENIFQERDIC